MTEPKRFDGWIPPGLSALLLAAILGNMAAPAAAQGATAGLYACADKTDDAERLACFDAAVASLRSAEQAGEVATVTSEEVAAVQRDQFGRSGNATGDTVTTAAASKIAAVKPEVAETPDELVTGILRIAETPLGKLIVILDNGQVWEQTDSRNIRVSRRSPPDNAVIKKAALGSFRMKLGNSPAFRARRID